MKQPRLHRPFYRNGPSHRDGADVSFADLVKIFQFRSVTIGKWVTKQELQMAANLFFDAFCDLMLILDVPESVISLNGTLCLAFGTGGKPTSCAHYDARQKKLALAKNAGGGALAHEWFHAFDHYIARKLFEEPVNSIDFATKLWLERSDLIAHPLNQYLDECFQVLFLSEDKKHTNTYMNDAMRIDKSMNTYYFSQPQELAARAFEAFTQDHPLKNQFLVSGTKQSTEAKLNLYPSNEMKSTLNPLFSRYFSTLGRAVESKNKAI